jgi:hypothetical protein
MQQTPTPSYGVSGVGDRGMKNPDAEQRIQPPAGAETLSGPFGATPDASVVVDPTRSVGQKQRTLAAGTAFGAVVGSAMGAAAGAATCWLTGLFDFLWQGALLGTLAGPFAGGLIGFKERKARGDLVRPDIATIIGPVFGLLPGLLIGLQTMRLVTGRKSVYLFLGAVLVGPVCGLLIGGVLDRGFEAFLRRSWGRALALVATGVGICLAVVGLIDTAAYGPAPDEVATEVRGLLHQEWGKSPDLGEVTICKVALARQGRRSYTGFADVTFAGQPGRLMLGVRVEGGMLEVRWTAGPPEEPGR